MDDQNHNDESNQENDIQADEREILKARARMLGVEFSNNIGTDTLRERIAAKLSESQGEPAQAPTEAPVETNALTGEKADAPVKKLSLRQYMRNEQMKLVRVRITCLDPKKKDLPGEIVTVANEYLGTVRKFVPFGEVTDDGYHIPYCLYTFLEERKFLNIRTVKNRINGQINVESNWAKEFAIEVLPQLTPADLERLRNAQAAASNT